MRIDSRWYWFKRFLRNKNTLIGACTFILLLFVAVGANQLSPFDPADIQAANRLRAPDSIHYFGTDGFGRDILSRVIFGTRVSLVAGGSVAVVTTLLGTLLGLLSGYYRRIDNAMMRILDGLMAFPPIILQIAIMTVLSPSLLNVVIALSIVYIPRMARVVRSAILVQGELQYVEAARSIGLSDIRILVVHILPNCVAPIIVQATMMFAFSILAEASLSFLGVGLPPEVPTWGTALNEGRVFMWRAPWICIYPGLAITLSVLSLNMLGDGLRDILDPKIRKKNY
jgi:peptide/nickel transport system permease protein